jgi:hypothetical protein
MPNEVYLVAKFNGQDISYDVTVGDGKANPFGWSAYDLMHLGKKCGTLYCGEPRDAEPGYEFSISETKPVSPWSKD